MKPLSVEMACLLGIQNEIQAVCPPNTHFWNLEKNPVSPNSSNCKCSNLLD